MGPFEKRAITKIKTTTFSNASGDADVVQTLWACSGTVAFGGSRTSRGGHDTRAINGVRCLMIDHWHSLSRKIKINMIHDLGGGLKYL